jgi:hypothetical protein
LRGDGLLRWDKSEQISEEIERDQKVAHISYLFTPPSRESFAYYLLFVSRDVGTAG